MSQPKQKAGDGTRPDELVRHDHAVLCWTIICRTVIPYLVMLLVALAGVLACLTIVAGVAVVFGAK